LLHTEPEAHANEGPQPPQLLLSVLKFVHAPEHWSGNVPPVAAEHDWHEPATQLVGVGHVAQAVEPQWNRSVCVSVHTPHEFGGNGHVAVQKPFTQCSLLAVSQTCAVPGAAPFPQAPQLLSSPSVFTQAGGVPHTAAPAPPRQHRPLMLMSGCRHRRPILRMRRSSLRCC